MNILEHSCLGKFINKEKQNDLRNTEFCATQR